MISIRMIICILLYVAIKSETQRIDVPEDLVDEYYTTILKPNDDYLPQDEKDAEAIIYTDRSEVVIAGILPYRDKIRRFAINQRMATKIKPYVSYERGKETIEKYYWISERDFILQKLAKDKVMAEMIAVIVDPKYKPTTFAGKPDQG